MKISYLLVKDFFAKNDCELLSQEYKNAHVKDFKMWLISKGINSPEITPSPLNVYNIRFKWSKKKEKK